MDAKLQQQLFEKYPLIFQDRGKPMAETAMCWGLRLGMGGFRFWMCFARGAPRTWNGDRIHLEVIGDSIHRMVCGEYCICGE